jgi:hypothetical protein
MYRLGATVELGVGPMHLLALHVVLLDHELLLPHNAAPADTGTDTDTDTGTDTETDNVKKKSTKMHIIRISPSPKLNVKKRVGWWHPGTRGHTTVFSWWCDVYLNSGHETLPSLPASKALNDSMLVASSYSSPCIDRSTSRFSFSDIWPFLRARNHVRNQAVPVIIRPAFFDRPATSYRSQAFPNPFRNPTIENTITCRRRTGQRSF